MLNKYYNQQNQIVEIHGNAKYTKNPIKKLIINNKLDKIRNELFNLGNEFLFLFNDYYSFIKDNISLNITEKEISDMTILKREYDKRERNQKEIRLAKDFIKELSDDYWMETLTNEKEIILILDNATIHKAVLTKKIAKLLNINLIYLPKYASDLNPIERLGYAIKHELSTEFIEDVDFLKELFYVYFDEYTQSDSLSQEFMRKFII
jgi:hypothetical protein